MKFTKESNQIVIAKVLGWPAIVVTKELDFKYLNGRWNVSVQTNNDESNRTVKMLYKIWGFAEVGTKKYQNRTDIIMGYPQTSLVEWI